MDRELSQAQLDERRRMAARRRSAVRGGRVARRRIPLYRHPAFTWPLLILTVMGLTIGALWWFSPVVNEATGEQGTKGDQLMQTIGIILEPKKSLDTAFAGQKQVRILVMGLDHVPVSKIDPGIIRRSDSNIIASVDFVTKQIRLLSIPRDGWVQHCQDGKRFGYELLGHSFSLGQQYNIERGLDDRAGGISRTTETVENLLDIDIDYYIVVEFEGLVRLVDELGGLTIDVEKDMNYDDNAGGLHIHLKKGTQHLTGQQVLQYARFRHDAMGDINRMPRQQKVIKLVLKELAQMKNIGKLKELAAIFNETVQTNLTLDQLIAVSQHMDEFNPDHVKSQTLNSFPNLEPGHEVDLPELPISARRWAQAIFNKDKEKGREFLMDLAPPPPPEPELAEGEQPPVEPETDD